MQYGDHARQQRQRFQEKALAYWERQLVGATEPLALPADRHRPQQPTFTGGFLSMDLPDPLCRAIRQRCAQQEITPFLLMLSAFLALLYRYTHQRNQYVGIPISNRNDRSLEQLIGFFNETAVVHGHLTEDSIFSDVLRATRATVLEAFAHKDVPFEAIVRAVNPPRRAGMNPLFQAMFNFYGAEPPPDLGEGIALEYRLLDLGATKFDLTLHVSDRGGHLRTLFEYAADLYDRERIEDLQRQYVRLLTHLTTYPNTRIADFDLVTEAEVERICRGPELVGTQPEPELLQFIGRRFGADPERIAIVQHERAITYRTLQKRADALAERLGKEGVVRGELIAVRADRSPDTLVAILGVLLAGGTYLAIDPTYPGERQRFMLTDSGARLSILPGEGAFVIERISDEPPGVVEDGAYLIYTSGSSGQPKGVTVSRANLLSSTRARLQVYGSEPMTFLLLSAFSFDSSVAGIFGTFSSGGTLVIPQRRAEQDMHGLSALIARHGVTQTLLLPTLYRNLLQYGNVAQLRGLRTVIVAGEACSAETAAQHFATLSGTRLFNEYGPTEATVWSTVAEITPETASEPIPIGRPVPGYRAYVTDQRGRLLPAGVSGELCIGGPGVTAGYWRRPEQTDAAFTSLHLPGGGTERVYRTGDLARFAPDGNLVFLGRRDEQIKVRGYRIELAEITAALMEDGTLEDAITLVDANDHQLLSFVIERDPGAAAASRERLRERLPDYMVPGHVLAVEGFPQLPNGKVDRSELLRLGERQSLAAPTRSAGPSSPIEETLLSLWQDLLPVSDFGVNDNFFSLGGDSILSIQLVGRARAAGLILTPTAIFDHQTIAELATAARPLNGPATAPEQLTGPCPLTPIQHWFLQEHRRAPAHWNQGWQFSVPAGRSPDVIGRTARSLWQAHDGLRLTFHRTEAGWQARVGDAGRGKVHHPLESFTGVEAAVADWQTRQDLERGPLFAVFSFADRPDTVVVVAHHLVVDAVSWRVILEAFTTSVAPPAASWTAWANTLKEWSVGQRFLPELPFWQEQTVTPLATDYPVTLPVTEENTEYYQRVFPSELTGPLTGVANEAYGTRPEEILLSGLLLAIAEISGQHEHCLNLERHGREPLESEVDPTTTVGWFTTSFPLRFRVQTDDIPRSIVAVKERLRSLPNKGIGYGVLRYLSKEGRELDQAPLIYFNYLGRRAGTRNSVTFLDRGMRHPEGERHRLWEFNVEIVDDCLQVYLHYAREATDAETAQRLIDRWQERLGVLINHCAAQQNRQLTPSDFPDSNLDQHDLDALLNNLSS